MSAPALPRRRFLALAGCAALAPGALAAAPATRWQGLAMGAPASILLHGDPARAEGALARAVAALRRVEAVFSLHDPRSSLARLNREGRLDAPPADLLAVLRLADEVHHASEGRFDPTVQPLWRALAQGQDARAAREAVGWTRVRVSADAVILGEGQALTLNGIAQGWAADRVSEALLAEGFAHALVDAGEIRGLGGPWRLGIEDPGQGVLGARTIHGAALATSSPLAMRLGPHGHILDPRADGPGPAWSTITVEAGTAALADAASTALCLAEAAALRAIAARLPGVRRVIGVDARGDLSTLA